MTALGDGPTRSTLQRALDIRVGSSERWLPTQGDAYRSLNLSIQSSLIPTTSILDWKVDGSLTALVMIQLLLEPYPVNPFLVYAAFFQSPECLDFLLSPYLEYKPEHLLAMIRDPETRELVAAVLAHTPDETFTTAEAVAMHPLLSRAIASDVIKSPISMFYQPRDPEQHKALIRLLLSELLIGHATPWELRQFQSFSTGLRLGICGVDDIVKVCDPVCHPWILRLTTA